MRMRGALTGGALAAALLACGAGPATAASDPGWFEGHSREERQAIVNYVYERTGHEPPHEGIPETLSSQITDSVLNAGEDEAPFAGDVGGLELVVGTRVGLMTRLTTMFPTLWVAAGAGTFVAGYAIGTGARKLFTTLTAPDDAATGGTAEWSRERLDWRSGGSEIFFGATVQQYPGAYLYGDGGGVARWFEPPCTYSGFTPPTGARMEYAVPSTAECAVATEEGMRLFPVYVNYPYLLETDIRPVAPLRPIETEDDVDRWEPYPPDPGATAVEEDLDALDEDGNDLLRDQVDWALTPGSQPEEEPARGDTRYSEEDRACKAYFGDAPQSDPGARSPEADPEAEDWDYDVDEFEGVYNPATRSTQTVKLRWGTRAWGYRHVVLGHGWNAAAAARTALALTDRSPTSEGFPESYRYVAELTGGPRGVTCKQRVIVSYSQDGLVPPGRHIITSFVDGVE